MATGATAKSAVAPTRRTQLLRRRWTRYNPLTFYAFVAPWVLGFLALTVIPLIYALAVSFTNFDGISGRWKFIGWRNYIELFHDPDTWFSLGRTALFTGITVPAGVMGGLALAMLLNQRARGVGLFRTLFYLPSVVPVVAGALMWKLIFDRDVGALNAIWEAMGGHTITWLIDPTAFYAMIILVLWGVGGSTVIILAGLQGIPQELKEASAIDGANGWQTFRHITLPMLSPVLFFLVVTGTIGALQTFLPALLLETNNLGAGAGGNGFGAIQSVPRSNYLYMVHVYSQFFAFSRFGYGSALLWVLFALILLMTLIIVRSSSFWVYYEVNND